MTHGLSIAQLNEAYDVFAAASNDPQATMSFVCNHGYGWELDCQLIDGEWTIEPYDDGPATQRAERNFGC